MVYRVICQTRPIMKVKSCQEWQWSSKHSLRNTPGWTWYPTFHNTASYITSSSNVSTTDNRTCSHMITDTRSSIPTKWKSHIRNSCVPYGNSGTRGAPASYIKYGSRDVSISEIKSRTGNVYAPKRHFRARKV